VCGVTKEGFKREQDEPAVRYDIMEREGKSNIEWQVTLTNK